MFQGIGHAKARASTKTDGQIIYEALATNTGKLFIGFEQKH